MEAYTTVEEYIQAFPPDVRQKLKAVRATIREVLPEAKERIAYGIPTYTTQKNVVSFGGYSSHIGFYPAPSGIEKFKTALEKYQTGKGTLQFPLDQPLPLELIKKVTLYRAQSIEDDAKK